MPAYSQSYAPAGPSRPPAARGEFSETPFAHLLARLYQHGMTGTLLIDVPDVRRPGHMERIALYVDRGLVCAATAGPAHRSLAPLVVALCARPHGRFALHRDEDLTGEGPGVLHGRYHPLALLTAAVRAHACDEGTELVLNNLGVAPLALAPDVELRHYGFNLREQDFIRDLNRQPAPLNTLLARGPLLPKEVRRLVYLLTLTGAVVALPARSQQVSGPVQVPRLRGAAPTKAPGGGGYSIVNAATPEAVETVHVALPSSDAEPFDPENLPAPPRRLPEPLRQRWVGVLLAYRRMHKQNHFQLLGVERRASESAVKAQYWKRIAPFQPDTLPQELAPLRGLARDALSRLSEARNTLCDPEARRAYCDELDQRQARRKHRSVAGPARGATDYDEATALMRRRMYSSALEAARRAVALDDGHAGYHALCGALIFLTGGRAPDDLRAGVHHLTVALRFDPQNAMAHHYRGLFFKREGDTERAANHFQLAARLDPANLDTAREVRLLETRSRTSSSSGLMKRIRASLRPGNSKAS